MRAALAADDLPSWIEVARTPETSDCPDGPALVDAVEQAADPEGSRGATVPDEGLRFYVAFMRVGPHYVATIREQRRTPFDTARTIASDATDCTALGRAVVVSIVVLLDRFDREATAPAAPPPPQTEPHVAVERPAPPPPYEADEQPPRSAMNAVFGEVLGAGLADSLNYERFLGDDVSLYGFGQSSFGAGFNAVADVAIGYAYLPRRRGFVFGVGLTAMFNGVGLLPWLGMHGGFVF